ncbi:hypothetical protein ABPG72_019640 [Tetrahymena utriculariae]
MKYTTLLFLVLVSFSLAQQIIQSHNLKKQKIAFGSCNKFFRNHKSDIFYDIAKQNPDVWVWLGDVAYLDNMSLPAYWIPESDFNQIKLKLDATKYDPAYQEMLKKVNAEVGVWDDHDYGHNNSGMTFKYKEHIRQVWLDFFNEPQNSERRTRDSGIYTSYYLGEQKKIKIILTDVRWNRQSTDILGEKQWKWLEQELNDPLVELFILGTGSQFLPDDRFIPETWDIKSKERFYYIVNKTRASVVIISGDVHYAELMEHPCSQKKVGYKLVEITSSALSFNFNSISYGEFESANYFVFTTPTYNEEKDRFNGMNYGIIEVEWDENNIGSTIIKLQVYTKGQIEKPVLERIYKLEEFKYSEERQQNSKSCIVDDIPANDRWKAFALNNLKKLLTEFNPQIIIGASIKIVTLVLLLRFYWYLIYMVFFYQIKEKKD